TPSRLRHSPYRECRFPHPLPPRRSEEHTSELQSRPHLVCRLLLEKKTSSAASSSGTGPPYCPGPPRCCCRAGPPRTRFTLSIFFNARTRHSFLPPSPTPRFRD